MEPTTSGDANLILNLLSHNRNSEVLVFLIFFFSGLHPRHREVPRLGVESELQLPVYTTATVKLDLSRICDLCRSLWHR